ncbi:MAG TPA: methyltransferase domain-containing protein [Candidatus Saccharimonadales bacterium]|nr:methyltransferase domain-containing protein [Candidatus Saccharimonadales bacterium]
MPLAAILLAIAAVISGCFGFVLLFGAPFVPTLSPQVAVALDLLDLKPGQTLLELGCGDGIVLLAAAQRGIAVVGYELNPVLALIARWRTRQYRHLVRVICGNFWSRGWPPADGIFVFLLPRYMGKLHKKVMQYAHKPLRLASFAFEIPEKVPSRELRGVFLYEYK